MVFAVDLEYQEYRKRTISEGKLLEDLKTIKEDVVVRFTEQSSPKFVSKMKRSKVLKKCPFDCTDKELWISSYFNIFEFSGLNVIGRKRTIHWLTLCEKIS